MWISRGSYPVPTDCDNGVTQEGKLHLFRPRIHCHLQREKRQGILRDTMTAAPTKIHPDSRLSRSAVKSFWTEMTQEEMSLIFVHLQAWEKVVKKCGFQSDEADMLSCALFEEVMRCDKDSMPDGYLSEEEKLFLSYFPLHKFELEQNIKELNTLADQVDTTHKLLTKTSLVASSSGAVSGVMSLLGLALAPVTAGGSLMLSAAATGLGAAAAITNIVTNVLENRSNSAARDKASRLGPLTTSHEAFGEINWSEIGAAGFCVDKCVKAIKGIRDLRAYQMAKANSGFMAMVKNFVVTRHIPFWRARGVQRAFEGTTLAMTNGARVMGAAGAGFLLLKDMSSFLQSWKHLEDGARTETAEELRTLAKKLEQDLDWLTERHRHLLQKASRTSSSCRGRAVRGSCAIKPEVGHPVTTEL
ncbi:apolipoprotein L5 isoform X3 [Piliocolobus tephrosceles]|uniref:apolipoprotein L5 isoform X3 n=1 Tax=Piliocolobus tephrosceles TaxID=591936 RepID=UPI000E6AFB24|nr:apolipoprotein L5 isoform X3 [Piliocolobus tephrosceles]